MDNVQGITESVLIIFGGLVAEVNAPDVPAGSSPLCCDMDFTVASAKSRDGLANVYKVQGNALFEDNFATDQNQDPLNPANWLVNDITGSFSAPSNLSVLNGQCQVDNASFANHGNGLQTWVGNPGDDCFIQFTIGNAILGGTIIVGSYRSLAGQPTNTGYGFEIVITTAGSCSLILATPGMPDFGSGSGFLSFDNLTISPGDIIMFTVSGNTHSVYQNGNLLGTANDNTYLMSGSGSVSIGIVTNGFAQADITLLDFKTGPLITPTHGADFTWVKSFEMTSGEVLTLALDVTGILWQENVVENPGVLTSFYTAIEPNSFAKSVTQDDREFIAISDLKNGTDMPRGYNGQWLDRLSQVGPGAPPSVTFTSTQYPILASPNGVIQPAPVGGLRAILWSSAPGVGHSAGNVITVYYGTPGASTPATPADPNLIIGRGVVLSGFQNSGSGQSPNGNYIVSSVQAVAGAGGIYNTFSVQSTISVSADYTPVPAARYQATVATVTTTVPVPGVQVGSQITLVGVGVSAWNATWTVVGTPNAAQMNITQTSLTSNVATYDFTLVSGTLPSVGEQVTVTGCTNGPQQPNGSSIFNVVNAVITSVTASSFSISITAADVSPGAEPSAQAIINGTEFQFDPGIGLVGSMTSPFFGNSGGGNLEVAGQLTAGTRQCVVMFLTRNGFLTAPSPPITFTLNETANAIVASNIPIGPPNVIARVLAFTGSNGGFFFWIPDPVTIVSNGQQVTYNATVVEDNITTQATFNFTDGVLLAAASIDSQGSNNFNEQELGSSIGMTSYASRLFAWGEQSKITNLLNLSFDGGYLSATIPFPLGWKPDATNGAGGSLQLSPIFGDAYYILNSTGSIQSIYGMIWQGAFQDAYNAPIILPQVQYGVRITASSPSGGSGNLVVDLYSPTFGNSYGSFSIPISSLTTTMQIFTGNLLTSTFLTQVPSDLRLRIYAANISDGSDVLIDRIEPFDLANPVKTTGLTASYFDNFEAFDDITGNLGFGTQNQQPVRSAFELFDNLYAVKTHSFYSTSDNGTTEPNFWQVREVSNKVGTPSINGVDVGEGWALIAGEAGLYIFSGGDPIKISPEIDPVWRTINWTYGYTLWLKNDTVNRRILIGVPIPTPNQWMPRFPANLNPKQPNVVLMCNYKELMSAGALATEAPVRLTYMGDLKTFALGRKWSAWSIQASYADFITRADTTQPLFFCGDTNTGKIYQQIPGNYSDDGAAIPYQYVTYPFPKAMEAQALQMGYHQLLAHFMSLLIIGSGNLRTTIIPDTLTSPDQEALQPEALANPPSYGDMELPLNIEGNRFFVELSTLEAGEWFEISKIVMALGTNPWGVVRGSNG